MLDLVTYLRQHVPLTRQIDIRAGKHSPQWLELCAPLEPNINDKHTAFGGTLATLCTLSGWCAVSCLCRETGLNVDIAVTQSHIRYHRPVTSELITARAYFPQPAQADQFVEELGLNRSAKLEILAEANSGNRNAVTFSGEYYVRILK